MALRASKKQDHPALRTLAFLQEVLRDYHPRDFSVELWDGTRWEAEPGQFHRWEWRITRPGAVRAAFTAGTQLAFAEGFIYGDFDLAGDIHSIFRLAEYFVERPWTKKEKLRIGTMLLGLPSGSGLRPVRPGVKLRGKRHSKERDRRAISYHYDVSNEFYSLWLDENLVYSCAYFSSPDDDLDTAQVNKLDYICRKLRLKSGDRLLDIGCGWGGLILHAAREYGVRALGITLSQEQFRLAEERIRQANLSERCEVKLLDYRDVPAGEPFDKIVSVGMVEHVGESSLKEYFGAAYRLLRPGGVFLNHGIGTPENYQRPKGPTFADAYVFPDGELLPIGTTTRFAERAGFEVRDVENLREHYALTCRHWVERMEQHAEQARRLVDEVTFRIWRLHMAGSAYYFRSGKLDLYQTLLVKNENGKNSLPMTREDWYQS